MSDFAPQNYIYGPDAIASKGLHGLFSVIYIHISVHNQDVLGMYEEIPCIPLEAVAPGPNMCFWSEKLHISMVARVTILLIHPWHQVWGPKHYNWHAAKILKGIYPGRTTIIGDTMYCINYFSSSEDVKMRRREMFFIIQSNRIMHDIYTTLFT